MTKSFEDQNNLFRKQKKKHKIDFIIEHFIALFMSSIPSVTKTKQPKKKKKFSTSFGVLDEPL